MSVDALLSYPMMRPSGPVMIRMDQHGTSASRRTLSRRWGDGLYLPWILLNPSMGDDLKNDPTILRIIHFTWMWGFDGFDLFNVYDFRTPKPSELAKIVIGWADRGDVHVRDQIWGNHRQIAADLSGSDAAMVAWGAPGGKLGYETDLWLEGLFDGINDSGLHRRTLKLWALGETKGGDPKHPLARGVHRVPNDTRPVRYRNRGTFSFAPIGEVLE